MKNFEREIKVREDTKRGLLAVFEYGENCPFEVKRTYCIIDVPEGVERGFHAHKHLEQICVCLKGSCEFDLDDGKQKVTLRLDSPRKGIYLPNAIWHVMKNFSKDCVLLVLASDHYDENDYIRDYDEFLNFIKDASK